MFLNEEEIHDVCCSYHLESDQFVSVYVSKCACANVSDCECYYKFACTYNCDPPWQTDLTFPFKQKDWLVGRGPVLVGPLAGISQLN